MTIDDRASADAAQAGDAQAGEYAAGRTRIRVSLEPDAPSAFVGEPVHMTLALANVGTQPVDFELSWMGRNSLGRPDNYDVSVRDERGATLSTREAGPSFGGQSWRKVLGPGERHAVRLLLSQWALLSAPGRYAIVVRTTLPTRDATGQDTPVSVEARASIDVGPASDEAMGALLARLEQRASQRGTDASAEEAERALLSGGIRDPRIVDVYVRLATVPRLNNRVSFVHALGPWPEERAVAAIERTLRITVADIDPACCTNDSLRQDSADSLRRTAAQALAQNQHPRALTLLLALRGDADQNIRLTVLQRAARLPRAQAEPIVRAMLTDSAEIVRGEARRLLGTLR